MTGGQSYSPGRLVMQTESASEIIDTVLLMDKGMDSVNG